MSPSLDRVLLVIGGNGVYASVDWRKRCVCICSKRGYYKCRKQIIIILIIIIIIIIIIKTATLMFIQPAASSTVVVVIIKPHVRKAKTRLAAGWLKRVALW